VNPKKRKKDKKRSGLVDTGGGLEGGGERRGNKKIFREINDELPGTNVPQAQISQMFPRVGPELLKMLARVNGAIAEGVELRVAGRLCRPVVDS